MKMPFLMQAVLLWFISTTTCVFRVPGIPAYLVNKPPLLFADQYKPNRQAKPDPPPLVADHFIVWPHRTTTGTASLQKPPSPSCQLGQATMKMPFVMQVSYLQHANCFRSSDPFLLAVSCPPDILDSWRRSLCQSLCSSAINAYFVCVLLMLAGDIESNPGPPPTLESIAAAIARVEKSQDTVLSELALIRATQSNMEGLVDRLSSRVDALEQINVARAAAPISEDANPLSNISSDIKALAEKCDDSENRLRRCNLLFFEIPDVSGETWDESEARIISFCSEKLEVPITAADIERAHRLGRFQTNKNRPIIVALSRFKDKARILSACPKLKDSLFSIREDYSARVRLARKKLFLYAQERKLVAFKIRFDKLIVNKKPFVYDADTDSVIELKA